MKKNMGNLDRMIRIVLGIVVGVLYWLDMISGTAALILGVFSFIFLVTSFVSFCPLYAIVGLNTCPIKEK